MKHYNGSFMETLLSVGIVALVIALFIPVFLQVRESQEQTREAWEEKQQYYKEIEEEYKDWKEELEEIVKEK